MNLAQLTEEAFALLDESEETSSDPVNVGPGAYMCQISGVKKEDLEVFGSHDA